MENNLVTVIIPARNEENFITDVVKIVKLNKNVEQIIVVNNDSEDNTEYLAREAGAEVVNCKEHGKGYAMEAGMKYVRNNIIVFLDADILNYPPNLIDLLIHPVINNEADFVKSTFDRSKGGVVTNVAIKPLLSLLFPNMYKFSEPISGMIACRKIILDNLEFEKDYGVDIGILLDVINLNYKVKEVNIGPIENMSHTHKTTEWMSNMSLEIMRAILKRIK